MRYNKDNFYVGTKATFKGCNRPSRKPDYISYNRSGEISSEYWYTNDGVIRCSNHWSIYYLNKKRSAYGRRNYRNTDLSPFDESATIFACHKISSCFWRLKTSKKTTNCGFAAWSAFSSM